MLVIEPGRLEKVYFMFRLNHYYKLHSLEHSQYIYIFNECLLPKLNFEQRIKIIVVYGSPYSQYFIITRYNILFNNI